MTFVERHCITFEQAKQLDELGVPNISAFKYRQDGRVIYPSAFNDRAWESDRTYPCFTDGELFLITGLLNTNTTAINFLINTFRIGTKKEKQYYNDKIKSLIQ